MSSCELHCVSDRRGSLHQAAVIVCGSAWCMGCNLRSSSGPTGLMPTNCFPRSPFVVKIENVTRYLPSSSSTAQHALRGCGKAQREFVRSIGASRIRRRLTPKSSFKVAINLSLHTHILQERCIIGISTQECPQHDFRILTAARRQNLVAVVHASLQDTHGMQVSLCVYRCHFDGV